MIEYLEAVKTRPVLPVPDVAHVGSARSAQKRLNRLNAALIHDWCPAFRGGERVLVELSSIFPRAPIYTLFDFLGPDIRAEHFGDVHFETSIANRLPGVQHYYKALFFACPFLIEQFDLTSYDLVISSSAAFARGVITRPDQPHFCYVHSPVRYAWDEQFSYLERGGMKYGPKGMLFRFLLHNLRVWDSSTAHHPDLMAANSSYVQKRIRRIYGRDAIVIHPAVNVEEFPLISQKDDYYVAASFMAPYKRTDLVIQAFNAMPDKRLVVVGDGQELKKLKPLAKPNIIFKGFLNRCDYIRTISEARALVFAGCEDFGIALAEAQAAGTPMIAFGRGGATDIVRPLGVARSPTGVLFGEQSATAIQEAIEFFESHCHDIKPVACHDNASRFSPERFRREIRAAIDRVMEMHQY